MARGETSSRLIRIIFLLETHPRGLSIREIHQKLIDEGFVCSMRTIYRDLEVVQNAYFPIVKDGNDENAKWRLNSITSITEKISFSYHELLALFLAQESLQALKGTALFNHITNFISRLEKALGPGAKKELQNLSQVIAYKASASWQTGVSQQVLDTVYEACHEGYVLEVEYKSKSGAHKDVIQKRRLGPESIYFADAGVYLIAKDLADGTHKTYSLSRIFSLIRTDDFYESQNFSIENFMLDQLGVLSQGEAQDLEVYITEPIASYVAERRWHESQQITRVQGGINLKMHVRINDEVARWVLGLGDSAQVKYPNELKDLVITQAKKLLEKY